jgi:transcriptional regulator
MYIPKGFNFENDAEKVAFMKHYSFATMVTNKGSLPLATQLPFILKDKPEGLLLNAHFALANEQAKYIEQNTSLVIFSEPHAYISPSHYDKVESVPTWDYVTVHAYGNAQIIIDEDAKRAAFEEMIIMYEPLYLEQWKSLSEKFKLGMMKGTVVFDFTVTDLQGQKKISQNKSEREREKIIAHLDNSNSSSEKAIADYIRKI